MIRSFTCVCALLAGASGLYLYSEKHRTTLLDQQISRVVADTQRTRERTAMLRAEWALLNQPDRLEGLATRFLPQLQAMAPTQFVQLAVLDRRLPPPGPEVPPQPIVTPATAPGLVGQKPSAPDGNHAVPPPAAAMVVAQAEAPRTTGAPPVRPVRGSAARGEIQLAVAGEAADAGGNAAPAVVPQAFAHRMSAPVHDAPHRGAPRPAAPARAFVEHEGSGRSRPVVATVASFVRAPVIAAATWRPARASWQNARPVTYAGPSVGSALGSAGGVGRAALPAPVPVSDSD